MVGRTPKEAIEALVASLQRAVLCVAQAQIVTRTPRLMLHPETVPLGRDRFFSLSVDHYYVIVPAASASDRWRIRTTGYRYTLGDREGRELVTYQWHPAARSAVTSPHLHLGTRLLQPYVPFGKAHLPTGYVTLADVLRVAIVDLGVHSRREDWEAVLRRCEGTLTASLAPE